MPPETLTSQSPSRRLVYLGSIVGCLCLHSKDPTRSLHIVLVSFTASRAVLLWQFIRIKRSYWWAAVAENCLLSVFQISKGQRNITWSLTKRIITDSPSFLSQRWDKLCFHSVCWPSKASDAVQYRHDNHLSIKSLWMWNAAWRGQNESINAK